MTWIAVARKDFRDAVRSYLFWALSALFLLLVGILTYSYTGTDIGGSQDKRTLDLVTFIASSLGLFVSLTAIIISYKSIAGEHESGSLKLLLSLPHTRRDVILGKVLGRSAVLSIPVVVALAVGTLAGMIALGDFEILAPTAFLLVSLLFVGAYVSIGVGLSALTRSTTQATALGVTFFVVFEVLWEVVLLAVVFITSGFSFDTASESPDWLYLLSQLPPSSAFGTTLVAVLDIVADPEETFGAGPTADSIDAFYGTQWIGLFVLLFWITVPTLLGYWAFERRDL